MFRRTYYNRNSSTGSSYSRQPHGYTYSPYGDFNDRYRNSSFDSPLLDYGPLRTNIYPWTRDYNWRRRRDDTEMNDERMEESGDERNEEEDKVEINKRFHVEEVDLNIKDNTKNHHTDKYRCTKRKQDPTLVVRRGQEFVVTITFDREYNEKQNDIYFYFKTGKDPMPPKRTAAKVSMSEKSNGSTELKEWSAKLLKKNDKSIDVQIVPPCNSIIGEWMFDIVTESKIKDDGDVLTLKYTHNDDIIILLNPWCQEDQVYFGTTALLNEYILNEAGAIFSGNYDQRGVKPWNFAQFQDGILDICLHLIRKSFNETVDPGMGDAVKLSRAITQIVNAPDDNGVLSGRWDGNYSDGTPPTKWTSSAHILREYSEHNGRPVKYGQCWVFSALTTTVCRAIGLPTRSVTNFESAHDTDGSTSIDILFEKKDKKWVEIRKLDSIWNFHVWNESWISRISDLGPGFDGWQAIDATPQETSEGIYCCGPAPVSAIKKGEIGKVKYDAPFIFAEVNGDVVHWGKLSDTEWIIINTDPAKVGKNISTKIPDGKPYNEKPSYYSHWKHEKYRLDITNEYKYPEGSLEERLAIQNANRSMNIDRDVFFKNKEKEEVSVEITDKDGVMVGDDFEVEVILKNIKRKRAIRTVQNLQISVDSLRYTGDGRREIVKESYDDITLDFEEEKRVTLKVKTDQYWDKMYDLFNMDITVFAFVKETQNYFIKKDDYRLRRPDIELKAPTEIKVGKEFEVDLSFKNTLPMPLTKCSLVVEGNGVNFVSQEEKDVPAKSEWKSKVKLEADIDGDIQINASFACEELKDIVGLLVIKAES